MTEEEFRKGFIQDKWPTVLTPIEREKSEVGLRFDQGKIRYDLLQIHGLEELGKVSTIGAVKYADFNYLKGMDWLRIFGSLMRHAFAWWKGEDYDPETGLHHMAHCAWNCLTLVEYSKLNLGKDNRWKSS